MKPSNLAEGQHLLAAELLEELSVSDAEYLAERGAAVNTNPHCSQYYSLFRIWLLS